MLNFNKLLLNPIIIAALAKKGYTEPTPIQQQSIPHLLQGRDLLGIAQTGTGKTAAFALPILNNLAKNKIQPQANNVRALILTPTRELASQIVDNIKLYGQDLGLRYAVIFGGVGINGQIKIVKNGLDIIVATPGRLLDLINQGHLKFSQLEIFVLDEADRMLDLGFIADVKKIILKLPKTRQSLFFSATMPKDVAILADSILENPVRVEVSEQSSTVDKIDQRINLVEKANKPLLLKSTIENEDKSSLFLVFARTKHGANRIVEFLEKQSIKVAAIHGNKSQAAREKALGSFRQGEIRVLVATDIAARGIDVAGITHVINYDIPNHPESYVHRIGRTARAGKEGVAISFCDNSELELLRSIEKLIKLKLRIDESHIFHGVKPSIEAKRLLDNKDRPKSGYRTLPQTRKGDEKPLSYFSQTRRWKNGETNSGKSYGSGFKSNYDKSAGEEGRNYGSVRKSFSRNSNFSDNDSGGAGFKKASFRNKPSEDQDFRNKEFAKPAYNQGQGYKKDFNQKPIDGDFRDKKFSRPFSEKSNFSRDFSPKPNLSENFRVKRSTFSEQNGAKNINFNDREANKRDFNPEFKAREFRDRDSHSQTRERNFKGFEDRKRDFSKPSFTNLNRNSRDSEQWKQEKFSDKTNPRERSFVRQDNKFQNQSNSSFRSTDRQKQFPSRNREGERDYSQNSKRQNWGQNSNREDSSRKNFSNSRFDNSRQDFSRSGADNYQRKSSNFSNSKTAFSRGNTSSGPKNFRNPSRPKNKQ